MNSTGLRLLKMLFLLCLGSGRVIEPHLVAGELEYQPGRVAPPKVSREYRAVWVAAVNNIDWPSSSGLTTERQKAELVGILDRAKEMGLNTVIFQVRPSGDALYASSFEPWSEYLTGVMGQAPAPYYDPLSFAIEEAHKRGLELHAWFNPYRARHERAKSPIAASHMARTKPHLVKQYGRTLWMDPGEPEVQEHSLKIVMDVVRRYDVDGIHFDDYFYPYPEQNSNGEALDFPDAQSWGKYGQRTGLSRGDWRRRNVDQFVQRVHASIRKTKPWVKFGISPFGIWRPGHPKQVRGLDAYESLYADSRKWLRQGWVDYFVPQLYWAIDSEQQGFQVLLQWWTEQNTHSKHLLAGLNTAQTRTRWKPSEISNQIAITRRTKGVAGHAHWNARTLLGGTELGERMKRDVYANPALPPGMKQGRQRGAPKPQLTSTGSGETMTFSWNSGANPVRWWVIQRRDAGRWTTAILPERTRSTRLTKRLPEVFAVTAIDRFGNASIPAVVEQRPAGKR